MRTPPQNPDQWPTVVSTSTTGEVRSALAAGADVNATDSVGRTAILIAAKAGDLDTVRVLIDSGADIDAQDQVSFNPLIWGCVSNNLKLVKLMVGAGANLNRRTRFDGVALHPPAEKGFVEIVRYLTEETNINVNHTNVCGWTPLLEAIILRDGGAEQQEIVRLLLAAGADPSLVDQWGVSPLDHAQEKGFTEIAAIIERAGH